MIRILITTALLATAIDQAQAVPGGNGGNGSCVGGSSAGTHGTNGHGHAVSVGKAAGGHSAGPAAPSAAPGAAAGPASGSSSAAATGSSSSSASNGGGYSANRSERGWNCGRLNRGAITAEFGPVFVGCE